MFAKAIICYICGDDLAGKTQYHLHIVRQEKAEYYSFCSEEHLKIFQGELDTQELETDE